MLNSQKTRQCGPGGASLTQLHAGRPSLPAAGRGMEIVSRLVNDKGREDRACSSVTAGSSMFRLTVGWQLALPLLFAADAPWPQFGGPTRDFSLTASKSAAGGAAVLWRRLLGPGTSSIVADGATLFTMYSIPDTKDKGRGEELVVAIDAATGATKWEHRYPVARLKKQESYSGDPIRPQATPALLDGRLCCLGYTGLLKCFDAATGRVLWEKDLVKEFDATPVQFGFSASPLVHNGNFVVHVGGKQAALAAFRAGDGTVAWKSGPGEPSYATPVLARLAGEEQIVQVTRDAILAVVPGSGATRWTYALPEAGLTNVPTPIPLAGDRLFVSGQGLRGSRLLQIRRTGDTLAVTEVWKNDKVQLFYCNAIADGDAVFANASQFIGALSLTDGRMLWRERGQADANLVRAGNEYLVLRGDGQLSCGRLTVNGPDVKPGRRVLDGRCWAPPTLVDNVLYVRDESEITAVRLAD